MAWFLLFVAGILEVAWAFAMKLSQGSTRPMPSAVMLIVSGLVLMKISSP